MIDIFLWAGGEGIMSSRFCRLLTLTGENTLEKSIIQNTLKETAQVKLMMSFAKRLQLDYWIYNGNLSRCADCNQHRQMRIWLIRCIVSREVTCPAYGMIATRSLGD